MREELKKILDSYTEEDIKNFQTKIDENSRTSIFGISMKLGCSPTRFYTKEGFEEQIDQFYEDMGFLYFFKSGGGISSIVIDKKKGAEAP